MKREQNYYYDAMEYLNAGDTRSAKKLLEKAIKLDQEYVEAYVGMTAMYRQKGAFKKEKEYADLAFEKNQEEVPRLAGKYVMGNNQ
jgi:Tfp pilus assembly protein PilF